MLFDPRIGCCFSGYRPEKFNISREDPLRLYRRICCLLDRAVLNAVDDGYTNFFCGMSRGFDLWAAQSVLRIQRDRPAIQLVCCLPCERQSAHWTPVWQEVYDRLLRQADKTFCLSREYYTNCFLDRNRFMVDACRRLICWYDGAPGGTRYTLHYAQKQGLSIVNLAEL